MDKYRAWLINQKRMITHTQDFIPMRVTNFGLERLNPTMENNHWCLVDDPVELMQFIRIKDSNGIEYYIGDIAEFTNGDRFTLNMEDCLEVYVDWIGDVECEDQARDLYRISEAEIIGNIHQHPELLENKND